MMIRGVIMKERIINMIDSKEGKVVIESLKEIKYGPFSSFEVFIDTISKYVDKIYKDVSMGLQKVN